MEEVSVCDHVGMSFRVFAVVALLVSGSLEAQTAAPFEVEEATIAQVHEATQHRLPPLSTPPLR